MKTVQGLLVDENLPPKLATDMAGRLAESIHVRDVQLQSSSDTEIWTYAAENGLAIVSRDADFHQRSFVLGHPPKVIWLRVGNCSTKELIEILRDKHDRIVQFLLEEHASYLVIERN